MNGEYEHHRNYYFGVSIRFYLISRKSANFDPFNLID
jgi:hypothetical protein